jgi:hypothetical protein
MSLRMPAQGFRRNGVAVLLVTLCYLVSKLCREIGLQRTSSAVRDCRRCPPPSGTGAAQRDEVSKRTSLRTNRA